MPGIEAASSTQANKSRGQRNSERKLFSPHEEDASLIQHSSAKCLQRAIPVSRCIYARPSTFPPPNPSRNWFDGRSSRRASHAKETFSARTPLSFDASHMVAQIEPSLATELHFARSPFSSTRPRLQSIRSAVGRSARSAQASIDRSWKVVSAYSA